MSKVETLPEAGGEAEVIETGLATQQPELNDKFKAIISLADQVDRVGTALDKVRRFVLARALPGDFVRFGDKVELGGPGAERIASVLGITFTNWRDRKDAGTDKIGEWYTWYYSADAMLGGRVLERVEGRAGSRDKFFGYENGGWKELSEVREADIRTAARRGVIKEGTKLMLGLRGLPFDSVKDLGLDPSKIKAVEFGSGGNTGAGAAAAPAGTPRLVKDVTQRTINKKDGTKSVVYVVEDGEGAKYETFNDALAKSAKDLKGKMALFDYTPNSNPKFAPKLKSISAVADGETKATDHADQEPIA